LGQPEESVFEAEPTSELWYEYEGPEGAPGRTTIVMNTRNVVVAVLVSLKEPISLGKAIERYGSKYVERKWSPCGEYRPKKDERPPLSTFIVYPQKGMYLLSGSHDLIIEIGYLLRCPRPGGN
jgi:hypothetical protein